MKTNEFIINLKEKDLLLREENLKQLLDFAQLLNNKNCLDLIAINELNNTLTKDLIDDEITFTSDSFIIKNKIESDDFKYIKI